MTAALGLEAVVAGHPSRTTTGIALALFGLGFGMVGQVLLAAVQNSVDRRELGSAMAATSFFRALGGAVGAAAFGAVFAAQVGASAGVAGPVALGSASRGDVIAGVQAVFVVAAPIALLALLVVSRLREVPLQTGDRAAQRPEAGERPAGTAPEVERAAA
jgi:MFS family permease